MKRRELPHRRRCVTEKYRIGGLPVFITKGFHDDGSLGEIFVSAEKTGASNRAMIDMLARCVSLLIQHGVPLSVIAESIGGARTEPAGLVQGHESIRYSLGIPDFVSKILAEHDKKRGG